MSDGSNPVTTTTSVKGDFCVYLPLGEYRIKVCSLCMYMCYVTCTCVYVYYVGMYVYTRYVYMHMCSRYVCVRMCMYVCILGTYVCIIMLHYV